ncbi:MAG: hypothetical protein EOP84_14830 [Verrucomicrobiaceae bacterium]|nr:MAG: hypothetical protein EOP84_14830 [Verrucomicrobiaceae bacterium]
MRRSRSFRQRAFLLFEVMLAVLIFSIGVIALGRCVENCLRAEAVKELDSRARRVLENRMAEIQAGAVPLSESSSEELKGPFAGMTLKMKREPLKEKNENDQEIRGIFTVSLDVSWKDDSGEQSRMLEFYYYPRQR